MIPWHTDTNSVIFFEYFKARAAGDFSIILNDRGKIGRLTYRKAANQLLGCGDPIA